MKNFDIKDLLIHILHGGIILAVAYFSFAECFEGIAPKFALLNEQGEISGFALTVLLLLSYLLGLMIDPLADCVDTQIYKRGRFKKWLKSYPYPSFNLLKNGNCSSLEFANHAIIRNILCEDYAKNNNIVEKIPELWRDDENTMLLFNYAKNRAFKCASLYQIDRIETYFRLFVFYRNMIWTTLACALIVFVSALINIICHKCWITGLIIVLVPVGAIALARLFFAISYKYRTYYCRMILGAVYSPK